jgi:hypothetical protein
MVVIRFPVSFKQMKAWADSTDGSLFKPIGELMVKHGRISHRLVTGDTHFLDFDEWPSREAYAAFKAEAGPYIDKFEDAFGHRSTDTVYDVVE